MGKKDLEPEIVVKRIRNRYYARLYWNDKIMDEMACEEQGDIRIICRIMLRWANKMGLVTPWTNKVRKAGTGEPSGKIWYRGQLEGGKKNEEYTV